MAQATTQHIEQFLRETDGDVNAAARLLAEETFAEAPTRRSAEDAFGGEDAAGDTNPRPLQMTRIADDLGQDESAIGSTAEFPIDLTDYPVLLRLIDTGNFDMAHKIMLELTPAVLNALCNSSRVFKSACDQDSFQEAYKGKWAPTIYLEYAGTKFIFHLFSTRTIADIKAYVVPRLPNAPAPGSFSLKVRVSPWILPYHDGHSDTVTPTAQSVIGGIAVDFRKKRVLSVVRRHMAVPGPGPKQSLRHFFADGTFLDVSTR